MGHVLYLFQAARSYHREGDLNKIARSVKVLEELCSSGNFCLPYIKNHCIAIYLHMFVRLVSLFFFFLQAPLRRERHIYPLRSSNFYEENFLPLQNSSKRH